MRERAREVERTSPSQRAIAVEERAWHIASLVRARSEWLITSASVSQRWTLVLDGARYGIEAYVSAFLERRSPPGIVFSVEIRPAASKHASGEHLLPTPWLREARARLGSNYAMDVERESIRLVRILRGTTEPARVLGELVRVSAALEDKTVPGKNARSAYRRARTAVRNRQDIWAVLEAVRSSAWRVRTISHELARALIHAGCRWNVSARFSVMVDSFERHPGFAGFLSGWSERARARHLSPMTDAARLVRRAGYQMVDDDELEHFQHWHRGLGLRAAEREVALLERAMELVTE